MIAEILGLSLIWTIILMFIIVFVIWQLISMLTSRIAPVSKGVWFILFILASFLTAIVWLFAKPRNKSKRRKK